MPDNHAIPPENPAGLGTAAPAHPSHAAGKPDSCPAVPPGDPATRDDNRSCAAAQGPADHQPAARGDKADRASQPEDGDHTVERAAEALLREHPDALVCALASDGLITSMPKSVGLWGQAAVEGRALIDHVVADDRKTVIDAWRASQRDGLAQAKVRLLDRPSRWMTLHFLDLRTRHGVLVGVVVPTGEQAETGGTLQQRPPARPRFATLVEDESGAVLECDEAFTRMFDFTADELIGQNVLDHIHPDDQGRAIEAWLTMLSTRRLQQYRLRRRRKDASWVWVDATLHNFLNQPDRNDVLVELIDVSAEMAAQEALQEREELLRRLIETMPDGLLQVDTERSVVFHNGRLLEILQSHGHAGIQTTAAEPPQPGRTGRATAETKAGKRTLKELLGTLTVDGSAAFEAALGEVLDNGVDRDVEADVAPTCGEDRRVLMSVRALKRHGGEVSGAITTVLDITDSARAREELERRATFDALTHCHNRPSILAALKNELDGPERAAVGVVFLDLDNFKEVNDTLGHGAGDQVLAMVAERLRGATRAHDVIGRLGGDEFLLVIRGLPEPALAMEVARRICDSLRTPLELSAGQVQVCASIGVACAGDEHVNAEELISRADAAMYRSKEARRGEAVLADRHRSGS